MDDTKYMEMALELAQKAQGETSPNPLVGCVIVDAKGNIVGKGYHHKAGEPHAEINALAEAKELAYGSTAYVTLEPCSHFGRTGPCCDALIRAGIKRVVAAAGDPNPQVAGQGFARLQAAGVEVTEGLLQAEAYRQNEVFFHWIVTGMPFVVMKYAMTMDGKIATASGDSKWITGDEARKYAHYLRGIYDCILVGKNTVLKDDPELTCRLVKGKNPLRIVLDTKLEIPLTAKVLTDKQAPTMVVAAQNIAATKVNTFSELTGVEVLQVPVEKNKLSLRALLAELSKRKLTSILVEGGSQVHGAFLDENLVQRVYAFIAPKIIGGAQSLPPIGGFGKEKIAESLVLREKNIQYLDQDILITGRIGKEVASCSQD
ncbi:MAG: bifunctional diaminohydroxyphosphoribosylaminopyrimidine deaminase/5-amino-6-(5-phosphoribosylamino)uracil reductase RibD [Acidaminococcaceae bacterium]|nr:bifunctional diaminohydroxyphosphoribosylaminopyrimidine deaminase/5-amino-6-(5-phosphoribosylamino)uracil reductase RibD [Acidaminococcaceae bacterium]